MGIVGGWNEASVGRHHLGVRRGYPAKKAWWAPQKKLLQDLVFSTGKNKVSTIKIQCEKEGEAKDQAC